MSDDSVSVLQLPFGFPFFDDLFRYAYLSSNGLMSFYNSHIKTSEDGDISTLSGNDLKGENAADDLFIVVLHRDLGHEHTFSVADQIQTLHIDPMSDSFQAQVKKVHGHLGMLVIQKPSDGALKLLSEHRHVRSVELNRRVSIDGYLRGDIEGMTSTIYSWGLDRIDQVDLPLDHATYNPPGDGSGVDVYVLDTGLDTTHTEFANVNQRVVENVFNGFGEVTPDTDGHGHGTHCAGTVGGLNVGVAPKANILGVKVLNDNGGGSTAIVVEALHLILEHRIAEPLKPIIVTMTWGSGCTDCSSDPIVQALGVLTEANITVVVAAGNSGTDACARTPTSSSDVITVGATTSSDGLSSFSNIGTCVDILAPGSNIQSACGSSSSVACINGTAYNAMSGTSMACPHAAGVAALWLSQDESSHSSYPPHASVVKNVLQCAAVEDAIDMWNTDTPNLLVQVSRNYTGSILDATCRNITRCPVGWSGVNCEMTSVPSWLMDSFCCAGQSLSDANSFPFNTIAFLWNDINPLEGGSVYYGAVAGEDAFAIVFENTPMYGSTCLATVEVILYATGFFEIIYVTNSIGNTCVSHNNVSIGLKGRNEKDSTLFQYEQLYGPSTSGIPISGSLHFNRIAYPSSSTPTPFPSNVPFPTPTAAESTYPMTNPTPAPSCNPSMFPSTTPSSFPSAFATSFGETEQTYLLSQVVGMCDLAALITARDPSTIGWDCNDTVKIDEVCSWSGVRCSHGSRIYSISSATSTSKFSGQLPESLGHLKYLKFFHFAGNLLSGSLPEALANLTSLEELYLYGNVLTGHVPENLKDMASLNSLRLDNNAFTGSLPDWDGMKSLQWLDVSDNFLIGPLPPAWGNITTLQWVYLYDNALTGSLPDTWMKLQSLSSLDLHDNVLTGKLPVEFKHMERIRVLMLYDNALTGKLPSAWEALQSMVSFDAHDNFLTGSLPSEWYILSSLKHLTLYGNRLDASFDLKFCRLSSFFSFYLTQSSVHECTL
jgi:hypothetical protein